MNGLGSAAMLTLLTITVGGSVQDTCNLAGPSCCLCAQIKCVAVQVPLFWRV